MTQQCKHPSFMPETIPYTCRRCGLVLPSQPLSPNPRDLRVYGLPSGWELGSALSFEGILPPQAPSEEDFCLCEVCMRDVERRAEVVTEALRVERDMQPVFRKRGGG